MPSFPLSQWSRPGYTPKPGRGKAYTPEEDQFIRDNCDKMTASQIAKDLGRCSSGVEKRRITSYNVCYTKLLRGNYIQSSRAIVKNGTTGVVGSGGRLISSNANCGIVLVGIVITSYSIHYTKLYDYCAWVVQPKKTAWSW